MTDGDIARRIAMGAPSYALSPDRGPSLPDPVQIPDAVGAIYLQVALNLSTWSQATPGACDPADFGTRAEDFTTPGPRSTRALASFQKWANSHGLSLRTDGALDPDTYAVLSRVAGEAAAAHLGSSPAVPQAARQVLEGPQKGGASIPWYVWLVVAAGGAYVFRHELGFGGSGS